MGRCPGCLMAKKKKFHLESFFLYKVFLKLSHHLLDTCWSGVPGSTSAAPAGFQNLPARSSNPVGVPPPLVSCVPPSGATEVPDTTTAQRQTRKDACNGHRWLLMQGRVEQEVEKRWKKRCVGVEGGGG